jgi:DNA-binding NtrC family response regulator
LAVDDDHEMLATYERIVSLDGHSLTPAQNAAEALGHLQSAEFDVILMDVRLTDMSGMAFYALLLEQQPEIARRVVFATGDRQSTDTMEFLNQSGRPFLIKPFLIDDLRRALAAAGSS